MPAAGALVTGASSLVMLADGALIITIIASLARGFGFGLGMWSWARWPRS